MNYFRILLPFLFHAIFTFAQHRVELKNISTHYIAQINVSNCYGDECSGNANIKLINKISKET